MTSKWNQWRAGTAHEAVLRFTEVTGGQVTVERAEMVGDLLCNLGHYCDQHGLDWEALVAQARRALAHERSEGDAEYGDDLPPGY